MGLLDSLGFGGGSASSADTGGYDVIGTGVSGDPLRGTTIQDVSSGSDDDTIRAIQENVDKQVKLQAIQRLQQQNLPQTVQQGFASGTSPYAQLTARLNLNQLPNVGALGFLNKLGQRTTQGILDRIQAGGIPVYDRNGQIVGVQTRGQGLVNKGLGMAGEALGVDVPPITQYYGRPDFDPNQARSEAIEDEFGNVIGYRAAPVFIEDDNKPDMAPAPVVAVAEPEPEPTMIPQAAPQMAGIYPTQGRYYRQGMLDVAPQIYGGLLASYDPTQYGAMNVGFRRPIDVGAYPDPRDVTGYTLL